MSFQDHIFQALSINPSYCRSFRVYPISCSFRCRRTLIGRVFQVLSFRLYPPGRILLDFFFPVVSSRPSCVFQLSLLPSSFNPSDSSQVPFNSIALSRSQPSDCILLVVTSSELFLLGLRCVVRSVGRWVGSDWLES